jgi:hypothetical protein
MGMLALPAATSFSLCCLVTSLDVRRAVGHA